MKTKHYKEYCFLKGKVTTHKVTDHGNPHYVLRIHDQYGKKYNANINLMSYQFPNRLKFFIDNDCHNEIIQRCFNLSNQLHRNLATGPSGYCLDYLRNHLFNFENDNYHFNSEIQSLKYLEKFLFNTINPILNNPNYQIGIWGMAYNNGQDNIIGIHDIHMNQGNQDIFINQNGIWQDGAIGIYDLKAKKITMFYFYFEMQCLKTNNKGQCTN